MDQIKKNVFWIVLGAVFFFNIYLYFTKVDSVKYQYTKAKSSAEQNKKYLEDMLTPGGQELIPFDKRRKQYCEKIREMVDRINRTDEYYNGKYDGEGKQLSVGVNFDTGSYYSDKTEDVDKPFGTFYLVAGKNDENRLTGIALSEILEYYTKFKARLEEDAKKSRIQLGTQPFQNYGLSEDLQPGAITKNNVRDEVRKFYIFREIYRVAKNTHVIMKLPHPIVDDNMNIKNQPKEKDFIPMPFGGPRVVFRDTESGKVVQGDLLRKQADEMNEVKVAYQKMSNPVVLGVAPGDDEMEIADPDDPAKKYKLGELLKFPKADSGMPVFTLASVRFDREIRNKDEKDALFAKYEITIEADGYAPLIKQFWMNLIQQEQVVKALPEIERERMFDESGEAQLDPQRRILFVPVKLSIERKDELKKFPYSIPPKSDSVMAKDPNTITWLDYFQPAPQVHCVIVLNIIYGKDNIKSEVPEIVDSVEAILQGSEK